MKRERLRIAAWPILRRQLKKVIKKINPDVIHAHFGPQGVVIAQLAAEMNIPLVTTFYGYDISRLKDKDFWVNNYQELWSKSAAITVLSKEMRNSIRSINAPAEKSHIIHLSRDLSNFEYRKPSGSLKNFISVGRLTYKKGHFNTIDAFKNVVESGYDVSLKIIGDGELRKNLEHYIKDQNIGDSIKLLGALPNMEVQQKMREADAFILCSKEAPDGDKEGTPTVLVEAQAVGLPCISTFHAGIPEMIPEENKRFLAEEGNVPQIIEKIQQLIDCGTEEIEQIALDGRKKVESDFNLNTEVSKIINLYKEIS
jgi:glycosyltransferase involved in cell wall biosynthesis